METSKRSLLKAISWQILGIMTTTTVAALYTGSMTQSIELTAIYTAVSLICYILHERVWQLIPWGCLVETSLHPEPKQ
jgi:uncharacterized membrane protein